MFCIFQFEMVKNMFNIFLIKRGKIIVSIRNDSMLRNLVDFSFRKSHAGDASCPGPWVWTSAWVRPWWKNIQVRSQDAEPRHYFQFLVGVTVIIPDADVVIGMSAYCLIVTTPFLFRYVHSIYWRRVVPCPRNQYLMSPVVG